MLVYPPPFLRFPRASIVHHRYSSSVMILCVVGCWGVTYIAAAALHLLVEKPLMNMEMLLWHRVTHGSSRSTGGSSSGGAGAGLGVGAGAGAGAGVVH